MNVLMSHKNDVYDDGVFDIALTAVWTKGLGSEILAHSSGVFSVRKL